MSRRARKKDADEDGGEDAHPASKPTKGGSAKKKPAAEDDDFPKVEFDMPSLEDDTEERKEGDVEEEEEKPSKPKKSRFPQRPPIPGKDSSSQPGSKAGSRRNSPDGRQHITKMEELDRWRWSSKYSEEGDQDEIRLAENLKAWSKVVLPDPELTDVSATMQFRKFLWKNKKLCRDGIPPQFRLFVWEILSGAKTVPDRMEHLHRYQHYLKQIEHLTHKQQREIAADIPRALNSHPKYTKSKEGAEELKNILSAFAIRNPNIGYVNSLSHIAAYLLLYYQEEPAFWVLCAITDIVLPPDYFSQSLLGVRAECMLLRILVFQRLPKLHAHFEELGVDVYNVALKWLMTLYLLCLSKECIARIFDVLFLEGSNILVSIGLAFFCMHEKELLKINDLMDSLTAISKLGTELTNNDDLMRYLLKESKCRIGEEEEKRRQIERQVMENDYMKELQKTQLHRKVEEAKLKEASEAQAKREKEELEAVAMGCEMYKIGHWGDAKLTHVTMERERGEWIIQWKSKRKKDTESRMKISDCELHFGLRYGNFASRPDYARRFAGSKKLAFSLIAPTRSLDLVCTSSHDMDAWKKVFFRIGFPLKNSSGVQSFRRKLEKKKTIKRLANEKKGKFNIRVESDEEDYDNSDDGDGDESDLEGEHKDGGGESNGSNGSKFNGGKKGSTIGASSSSAAAGRPGRKPKDEDEHEEEEEEEKPKKKFNRRRSQEEEDD